MTSKLNETSDGKETVQLQLSKLQKDNKQIAVISAQTQKIKNQLEVQENEKVEMQQKIEDALKERLTSNLKLSDQRGKLENLIAENKTYRERISAQDDEMKKLNKQLK